MKRFSVIIVIIGATITFVVLVVSAFVARRQADRVDAHPTNPTGPITIGALIPLSGSAAAVGIPIRQAAELAVNEVNAAGGIRGRAMQLAVRDSRCEPREAVNAGAAFITVDRVPVVFVGGCSSEVLAVAPLAERSETILFSPSATSPAITDAGDYVFRNAPSDASQGKLLAEAAIAAGYRQVGILQEDTDYAVGIADVFRTRLTTLGGTVTLQRYKSEADSVHDQLAAIAATHPDALAIVVQSPDKAELILQSLPRAALAVPILMNDVALGATTVLAAHPDVVEGAIGAALDVDKNNNRYQEFVAAYMAAFGSAPDYAAYAALSYDGIHLLAEAMRAVGPNSQALRGYLRSVHNRPGAAGTLTLDTHGDPLAGHVLQRVVHGVPTEYSLPEAKP